MGTGKYEATGNLSKRLISPWHQTDSMSGTDLEGSVRVKS